LQDFFERLLQQRHHKVEKALPIHDLLASMINRHEMWMAKGSYPARFCTEAIDVIIVTHQRT